jgi:hypothetical protein
LIQIFFGREPISYFLSSLKDKEKQQRYQQASPDNAKILAPITGCFVSGVCHYSHDGKIGKQHHRKKYMSFNIPAH